MLENIFKKQCKKINQEAIKEIKQTRYIVNLIESNYEKFFNTFFKKIKNNFKENLKYHEKEIEGNYEEFKSNYFKEQLYVNVFKSIQECEKELTKIMGSEGSSVKLENTNTQLGWEEWKLHSDKKNSCYIKTITPEGKKIVNEYRKIRNLKEL